MANRNIIVIGASAGGIEALQQLLGALPVDLDASVLIVLHTSRHAGSLIPQVMQRTTHLPVLHPKDHAPLKKGHVYIAPPDYHMIVEGNVLRVIQGPRENHHRPAIDPLFRSAAACYGRRVIGVILTGSLGDGTSGLMVVRAGGGEGYSPGSRNRLVCFHARKRIGAGAGLRRKCLSLQSNGGTRQKHVLPYNLEQIRRTVRKYQNQCARIERVSPACEPG